MHSSKLITPHNSQYHPESLIYLPKHSDLGPLYSGAIIVSRAFLLPQRSTVECSIYCFCTHYPHSSPHCSHCVSFSEYHVVGVRDLAAVSVEFLSLSRHNLDSFMACIFSWVDMAHFFLLQNHVSFYRSTTLHLFIHPLKGISIASKF